MGRAALVIIGQRVGSVLAPLQLEVCIPHSIDGRLRREAASSQCRHCRPIIWSYFPSISRIIQYDDAWLYTDWPSRIRAGTPALVPRTGFRTQDKSWFLASLSWFVLLSLIWLYKIKTIFICLGGSRKSLAIEDLSWIEWERAYVVIFFRQCYQLTGWIKISSTA